MDITRLRQLKPIYLFHQFDDSIRDSFIIKLSGVELTGRNTYYPNCLLWTHADEKEILVNPYDEMVMSLKKESFYENNQWNDFSEPKYTSVQQDPVFFFCYNVDNYFHFVYDTLPILASYFEIKKTIPNLKCLIQTSHPTKPTLSLFVKEFLTLLNIDYVLADPNVLYTTMFVSTSFTHGGKSNEPPSPMAYDIWKQCRYPNQEDFQKEAPKLFYVSRRSWVHGDTSNIGTNYTQRRKCINEDNLVVLLEKYGFQEVFTEQLATFGKLLYFDEAEAVVGIVGGGLCNLLFSTKQTKALCITTPYFMEINERFKYSMENANLYYTDCTYHANPEYKFKLYSRVRIIQPTSPYYNLIGEVEKVEGTMCTIHLSSNDVAGFSQDFPFLETIVQENELEAVDQGLNSPFYVDLEKFEADLKLMLSID